MKNSIDNCDHSLCHWPSLSNAAMGPRLMAFILAIICLGITRQIPAQNVFTDNFDSGQLANWQIRNVVQPLGGYVSDTFPANGSGRAFRLQRGSADMSVIGQPQAYGTGRAWLFPTNVYTDFYVAMDLVNWNNATNQALVLLARASGYDEVLAPGFPQGLGTVNGYVCNYDNLQDGDGPGDMLGGQFQINVVTGEAPDTIAAANVTLIPGHSYRTVFTGVGSTLTGQLYDYEDLTQPIVTIVAEDTTYSSGTCGITTFHRDDSVHPNLTDMTVDNFYVGPSDPNLTIAPAIAHAIVGTPQVVTRVPAKRFTNFLSPSGGVSFTVKTFSTNLIDVAATKLFLNGVDVSSALAPLPANGTSANFTTAAGTLKPNTVYAARIDVQDVTGTLKSSNTFWFDTFSESFLTSSSVAVIEAEDYNYSDGTFQLAPVPVSGVDTNGSTVNGSGVGYLDAVGTPDVDYHDVRTSTENGWNDYRSTDFVGTLQGNREDIEDLNHPTPTTPPVDDPSRPNDTTRSQYQVKGLKEYQVARTEPGEWLNYTRVFPQTNYMVYLRVGSFGEQDVTLDRVESPANVTNQTTTSLGTFKVPNQLARYNYAYVPLTTGGAPAIIPLGGTNTLRLTINGNPVKDRRLVYLNYLLFVPAAPPQYTFDDFNDGNDSGWVRYNPIGTGSWSFPGGNTYRIQTAASPDPATYFQGRAGSIAPIQYSDFYVAVDVVAWDDTLHQVSGIMARIENPGPATTTGYIFTHDRGDPSSATSGDMDIARLDGEIPTVLENLTGTDSIHFDPAKTYRIVFIGQGADFTGRVYELPNTTQPVVEITAHDETYVSGSSGLLIANNDAAYDGMGDVTFDNFLAAAAEPKLTITTSGGVTTLSWPLGPVVLQGNANLNNSSGWSDITSGIVQSGGMNTYVIPSSTVTEFYRLVAR